jgi:hypothetical protein
MDLYHVVEGGFVQFAIDRYKLEPPMAGHDGPHPRRQLELALGMQLHAYVPVCDRVPRKSGCIRAWGH